MRLIAFSVLLLASASAVWVQSAPPKAADPLAAVRAHLRQQQQAVPAHLTFVAHPTPVPQLRNPAPNAPPCWNTVPLAFTPNSRGR